MTPVNVPLRVSRYAPFVEAPFAIRGLDMSAATFAMHVRQNRDEATGTALITLAGATAGTQGISVSVVTVDAVDTSILTVQIDKATINAIPKAGKAGQDVVLVYDLKITGGGLPETRWFEGSFTIAAGSTQ